MGTLSLIGCVHVLLVIVDDFLPLNNDGISK